MKLRWTCTLFFGPSKWQNTEVFEPNECGFEFTTEDCETVTCPKCRRTLSKLYDVPEEIRS